MSALTWYECGHCEKVKIAEVKDYTPVYNSIKDEWESICDDCMADIADGIRTDREYEEMLKTR